ncbi:MAG: hypothetical protein LBQ81_14005 [Zoogloeaceae bacterium]|nr:hypothetical protein [Zoogloeaceae bacterium]
MTQASSGLSVSSARYGSLLRAVEGLRNWRAVLLSIIFLGAALLLTYLGVRLGIAMETGIIPAIFTLLAALVGYCGVSAVGLTLMDQAQELPVRPMLLAVLDSVPAALRIFAVALCAFVVVLIVYILMAILLFICKIPGIGPALYAVVFPVLVVVSGFLLFSLSVAFSMAAPAIWNGASIQNALAMLWQIATRRTADLLVSLILLYLLLLLVSSVVLGGILGLGFFSVAGLSGAILDITPNLSFNPLYRLYGYNTDGINYLRAVAFGGSVLFVLAFSALNAVFLLGLNLIYRKLSADLDPTETEKLIGQRLAEAREKAQAIKEESKRRLEEARELRRQQQEAAAAETQTATRAAAPAQTEAAETPPVAPTAPATNDQPAASLCPKCQTPITPGDFFCGECGNKLGPG